MSYAKMMRWNRRHPKGTRQPVLMSTGSGFQPSAAYLEDYFEYRAACDAAGVEPIGCKRHYDSIIRGGSMESMTLEEQVAWTRGNP